MTEKARRAAAAMVQALTERYQTGRGEGEAYVYDADDLTSVGIDGHVDMVALAEIAIKSAQGPQ